MNFISSFYTEILFEQIKRSPILSFKLELHTTTKPNCYFTSKYLLTLLSNYYYC
jgi:hypothetical protein